MSDITSPRTPSPDRMVGLHPEKRLKRSPEPDRAHDTSHMHPQTRGAITPPPSTQPPRSNSKVVQTKMTTGRQTSLASPPATIRTGPPITSGGLYGEVPTMDSVDHMDESQLRQLVKELLPALGEARVTAAHSKLQHSLLAIEKEEAAKRAEVEHEATRREVQVLQETSPNGRFGSSPSSPHTSTQRNLQLALAHCRELQGDNAVLEKRLRSSKKLIAQLDSENAELKDRIHMLRQRIKANRDHLNEMQSSGVISINGTPMMEYATPPMRTTPRTPATSRPSRDLDTLLMAGQMLSGEVTSVPSSPSPAKPRNAHTQHVRGAHSLSSLPSTPHRQPVIATDNRYVSPLDQSARSHRVSFSAPSTQVIHEDDSRERDDRDSTISASDHEGDSYRDDEPAGSQASQMATTMLRRSLETNTKSPSVPAPNSSKLLQGKIIGHVRKPDIVQEEVSLKRPSDSDIHDEPPRSNKKAKLTSTREKVGLGIKDWSH